jgi:hypothetical protein
MICFRTTLLQLLLHLTFAMVVVHVRAIITKEDPSSTVVTDHSSVRFFVALFEKGDCAGTVIGSNFVVTAAHCVCGADERIVAIDYKNDRYDAIKSYRNRDRIFDCDDDGPNSNDVAILEFETNVFADHDPRTVYSKSDEVSQTIWILGMGISGQPDDYPTARSCRKGETDGLLRQGFNTVDGAKDGIITYDMSPSSSNEQEAIAQDGDSGGPALILSNGEWMVAGANSGTDDDNSCDWGSVDMYCRLSEHSAWIEIATNASLDDRMRGLWFAIGKSYDDDDFFSRGDSFVARGLAFSKLSMVLFAFRLFT